MLHPIQTPSHFHNKRQAVLLFTHRPSHTRRIGTAEATGRSNWNAFAPYSSSNGRRLVRLPVVPPGGVGDIGDPEDGHRPGAHPLVRQPPRCQPAPQHARLSARCGGEAALSSVHGRPVPTLRHTPCSYLLRQFSYMKTEPPGVKYYESVGTEKCGTEKSLGNIVCALMCSRIVSHEIAVLSALLCCS